MTEKKSLNLLDATLIVSGSMIGSGGFIVYDDRQCIVRNTWNFSRFYHHESCGQCSPCREGTGWMEKVLHRLEHGDRKSVV